DLPVGEGEDLPLHCEYQDDEQEQEDAEDEGQRRREDHQGRALSCVGVQPPPRALIRRTLAVIRRPRRDGGRSSSPSPPPPWAPHLPVHRRRAPLPGELLLHHEALVRGVLLRPADVE